MKVKFTKHKSNVKTFYHLPIGRAFNFYAGNIVCIKTGESDYIFKTNEDDDEWRIGTIDEDAIKQGVVWLNTILTIEADNSF